eukprot:TRINITY_DN414_c0_g1_i3.p1 TRINITY_DN414_c0_g1~~TRINITY_DN414_c0_g1_i3.p1  ORF type:complete len:514 (+),score=149.93 TRINITY_DN414_c0_g1_i3:56-1597(+)
MADSMARNPRRGFFAKQIQRLAAAGVACAAMQSLATSWLKSSPSSRCYVAELLEPNVLPVESTTTVVGKRMSQIEAPKALPTQVESQSASSTAVAPIAALVLVSVGFFAVAIADRERKPRHSGRHPNETENMEKGTVAMSLATKAEPPDAEELSFPNAGDAHLAAALMKANEAELARKDVAKLESENAQLLDKIHSQEKALHSVEEERRRFAEAADARLAASQRAKDEAVARLEADIAHILEEASSREKAIVKDSEAKVSAAQQASARLQTENALLMETINSCETSIAELAAAARASNEAKTAMEEAIAKLEVENAKLLDTLNTQEKAIAEATDAKAAVAQKAADEVEMLKMQLSKIKAETTQLFDTIESRENAIAELSASLKVADKAKKAKDEALAKTETENAKLLGTISYQETLIADAEHDRVAAAQKAADEAERMKVQFSKLEAEKAQLIDTIKSREKAIAELSAALKVADKAKRATDEALAKTETENAKLLDTISYQETVIAEAENDRI